MTLVLVVAIPTLAFLLKFGQLVRRPQQSPLWVLVLALGLVTVVMVTSLPVVAREVGPEWVPVVRNAAALAFSFSVLHFLVVADRGMDPVVRRRTTRRQLLVVLAAAAAMGLCFLALPPADRANSSYSAAAPVASTAFYLIGNVYLLHASASSVVLAVQHSRRADRRVARGLRIAAAGLALAAAAGGARVVSLLVRAAGRPTCDLMERFQSQAIEVGLMLIVVGMILPGLVTRMWSLRRWYWHFSVYPRLARLRSALADALPHDAAPVRRRAFRAVSRRCYRRVVECRDGLLRLSPYLARRGVPDGVDDPGVVAAALAGALEDHRRDHPVGTAAIRVLPPRATGLDADIVELIALSEALAKRPEPYGGRRGHQDRSQQPEPALRRSRVTGEGVAD